VECVSAVYASKDTYATWKMHTLSRFMFGLLGFDFDLVGLSKPLSRAPYLKLYYNRQDSIVIETEDSIVW
jgi:hypothetical protein